MTGASSIVGRRGEIAALRRDLADHGVVVVHGPAGIGKTTTVAQALVDRPHAVGAALPALQWSPFFPLEMATRQDLETDLDDVAEKVRDALGDRTLWIEDLQWSHPSTAAVLLRLLHRVPLVLTTRTLDLPPAARRLTATAATLGLAPLDADDARRLLVANHPDLSARNTARVLEAAGGNPLMLGVLPRPDHSVAPSIRAAVLDATRRDGPETERALLRLAAFGKPAAPARFGPADESSLVERTEHGVWFRHARFAEALLEELDDNPAVRGAVHLELAALVGPQDAGHHLLEGGDALAALDHSLDRALHTSSAVETAHHLQIAVAASERLGGADAQLLLRCAGSLIHAQRFSDAIEYAVRAGEQWPDARGEAGFLVGRARWYLDDIDGSLEAYGDAAAATDDAGTLARIYAELAYVKLRHQRPGALEDARTAEIHSRTSGVAGPRVRALLAVARGYRLDADWETTIREVLRETRQADDRETEMVCAYHLTSGLGFLGRMSEANELHREQARRADEHHLLNWRSHFESARLLNLALMGGHKTEVSEAAASFLADRPRHRLAPQAGAAQVLALVDRGRIDEAGGIASGILEHATNPEERLWGAVALSQAAWAADDVDMMTTALDAARAAGDVYYGMRIVAELDALHLFDGTEADVGEPALPGALLPVLWPSLHEFAAFERRRDGDRAGAAGEFATAAAGWERHEMFRNAARARWAQAELLGDTPKGAAARQQALALARSRELSAHLARWGQPHAELSPREYEVLRHVADGLTSPRIARQLGLTAPTVDAYIRSARRKLGARTRQEAALIALGVSR